MKDVMVKTAQFLDSVEDVGGTIGDGEVCIPSEKVPQVIIGFDERQKPKGSSYGTLRFYGVIVLEGGRFVKTARLSGRIHPSISRQISQCSHNLPG